MSRAEWATVIIFVALGAWVFIPLFIDKYKEPTYETLPYAISPSAQETRDDSACTSGQPTYVGGDKIVHVIYDDGTYVIVECDH